MYDARDVTNFMLAASEERGLSISNLVLQKLLYFAHGWFYATFDEPLIRNKFEAWQYGPVQRVIYEQFKTYKSLPLNNARASHLDPVTGKSYVREPVIEPEHAHFVLAVLDKYRDYSASDLVNESHAEDGPWEYVWQQAEDSVYPGMKIPNELILLHFKRLPFFLATH